MTVIKRTKKASASELVDAVNNFVYLLEDQKEDEAVSDLRIANGDLQKYVIGSDEFTAAINLIVDAFEGDHELGAYTVRRKSADDGNWTDADQLYLASTKVLNLIKRFK